MLHLVGNLPIFEELCIFCKLPLHGTFLGDMLNFIFHSKNILPDWHVIILTFYEESKDHYGIVYLIAAMMTHIAVSFLGQISYSVCLFILCRAKRCIRLLKVMVSVSLNNFCCRLA